VAKIAENGNTMPHDRVFFLYNHFEKALEVEGPSTLFPNGRTLDVDRYTVGMEKTFFDQRWSVELRLPFLGGTAVDVPQFGFTSDHVGTLAVIVKRLIYRSDCTAACLGLGIDVPTGSAVSGTLGPLDFTVQNDATHLLPFLGVLRTPSDRCFYQAFLQVDVPANGDRVDFSFPTLSSLNTSGVYNEQALLYADFQAGYWLYRNPCACWLTGLAGVIELHYTTTLQDTDTVSHPVFFSQVTDQANHVDMLNMTLGLNGELARHTQVRVAGVIPLRKEDNRAFDSEVQVQVERRF
jgi:hypothetical protein